MWRRRCSIGGACWEASSQVETQPPGARNRCRAVASGQSVNDQLDLKISTRLLSRSVTNSLF